MSTQPWWQTAVVYQIYPRSFASGRARSSPGGVAGVGDLDGIIEHLDHIQWLGADTLWLSPIFRSPMADFGYDVSDFCDVDPIFGDLADLDRLVAEVHRRGMRILLDWVPNHTSIEHPWFEESRRDRTNPRANWYVWRDQPANNWFAAFPRGDSAWQFDPVRGQHYLRCFCVEQADLNWDEPAVEAAMLDTLRFWMDRGIDGFRMDVIHLIGKDIDHDDPPEATSRKLQHVPFNDVPVTHERLRRIRAVLDGYPGERTSVGEVYLLDEAAMASYYGAGDELHLSFNFRFLWTQPSAPAFRQRITDTLHHLAQVGPPGLAQVGPAGQGGWPTWVLSNHDVVRHRERHGGDERLARVDAMLLLTLPGTPFLYQGEELGLLDAPIPPDQQIDPGLRDGCRAPIPWAAAPLHGWPATPWLPFPPEAGRRNPEVLAGEPTSILHLYRALVDLRRRHSGLQEPGLTWLEPPPGAPDDALDHVLAYERGDGWMVLLNLGEHDVAWPLPDGADLVLSTDLTPAPAGVLAGRSGMLVRRNR